MRFGPIARLREFRVDAVTGGQDALGEVSVVVEVSGQSASGQGVATDIIEAAAIAYVRAMSQAVRRAELAARPDSNGAAGTGDRAGGTNGSNEGELAGGVEAPAGPV